SRSGSRPRLRCSRTARAGPHPIDGARLRPARRRAPSRQLPRRDRARGVAWAAPSASETNRPPGALVSLEMAGRILVGTSSWADPGFVEDWYPKGMAARDRLGWYAERFEYVEVNSSFYAVPAQKTVARWDEITPKPFTFDVK